MTREWFDRPLPKMPTLADLNRGEDEAYERWSDAEVERHARHADERTFIKGSEHGKN